MLRYLPFLLLLVVWIYAFVDCLNTPEDEVRKLPKVAWVLIILLFGQVLLGPVAWFWVGRPRRHRPRPYGATRPDERDWVAPDDNPEFLKSLQDLSRTAGTGGNDDTPASRAGGPGDDAADPDGTPRGRGDGDTGAGTRRQAGAAAGDEASNRPGDTAADGGASTDGAPDDRPDRDATEHSQHRADREDGVRDRDGGEGGGTAGPGDAPAS